MNWYVRSGESGDTGPHLDERRSKRKPARSRGRRRLDLPAWATVTLATVSAAETVALAWLAAGAPH